MYKLRNVSIEVSGKLLLSNINVDFVAQQITAIIGANGAGKSTLFKSLLGEFPMLHGQIEFANQALDAHSIRSISRQRAYIAQAKPNIFNMLVLDYLMLARTQYIESSKYSQNLVLGIAKRFDISDFLMRDISTLSGGELQIIEFVRAYLQLFEADDMHGKCLLLDEPASALDIKQTRFLYQYLKHFAEQKGTVIIIDHDINQVSNLADNVVLLKAGKVLASGKSDSVFTQSSLDECFDTKGQLIKSSLHKTSFYHAGFTDQHHSLTTN